MKASEVSSRFKAFALGKTWKPPGRERGQKTRWREIPTKLSGDLKIGLLTTTRIVEFPRIRIGTLIYPKSFEGVHHTATFSGIDLTDETGATEVTFRLEDTRNMPVWLARKYPKHPMADQGLFTTPHARMPGFDRALEYEIYAFEERFETTRPNGDRTTQITYRIIQAFVAGVQKNEDLVPLPDAYENSQTNHAWEQFKTAEPWSGAERKALKALENRNIGTAGLTLLFKSRPLLRILYCPLLFYLWPQSDLMSLSWKRFCDLADAIETGACSILSAGFSWLLPAGTQLVGALDSEGAHLLISLLGIDDHSEEQLRELLCFEILQRGLNANKKAGHTFLSSVQELAESYVSYIQRNHIQHFHLKHIISIYENPQHELHVSSDAVFHVIHKYKLIGLAQTSGVIKRYFEQWPPGAKTMTPVIYAGDDWIFQSILVEYLNSIETLRWRRDIHADGCSTEEDVKARIAAGKTARYRHIYGSPHWENPDFQREYARLDDFQREAVHKAVLWPITLVCGRPGTGKTQIFKTLMGLFGGANFGGCLPLATYGRIADMLRNRLEGWAHTVHKASASCSLPVSTPLIERLRGARTQLWDEGRLFTHLHTALAISNFSSHVCRLVIAGDPNQMDAIGPGGFFDSMVRKFKSMPGRPRYTELSVSHRFLTGKAVSDNARAGLKPLIDEDMAIDWNMRCVLEGKRNAETGHPDFAYTSDLANADARMTIVPQTSTINNVVVRVMHDLMAAIPRDAPLQERAHHYGRLGCQFVAQRHAECAAVNTIVYHYLFSTHADYAAQIGPRANEATRNPPLRIYERVTFTQNAYLLVDDEGNSSAPPTSDRELESAALARIMEGIPDVAADAQHTGAAGDMVPMIVEESSGHSNKRKKRPRDRFYRGLDSDDVFNGKIKTIARIVDVDRATGTIVNDLTTIVDSAAVGPGSRRYKQSVARLVIFDDDSQVNITDHYDREKITRAYCITSKKMQGSEDRTIINLLTVADRHEMTRTISATVYAEEFYTTMTRGILRFVTLVPIPSGKYGITGALESIREVINNPAPMRRNTMADLVAPWNPKQA